MKVLGGIPRYAVYETNFEAVRLALNYLGENYEGRIFTASPGLCSASAVFVRARRLAPFRWMPGSC